MTAELVAGWSVTASAPVRVADVGGWTDTWFGSPGRVCHVAVGPGVEVRAVLVARGSAPVTIDLPSTGTAPYGIAPGRTRGWAPPSTGGHPLVEHAVGAVLERVELPEHLAIELSVRSAVPPGASLGTSASVIVAVLAALDALVGGGRLLPDEMARLAHQVETVRAGREAGVQDQWAAALGGVGLLAIGPYPEVRHEPIGMRPAAVAELAERLVTVVFGPHDSSLVHAEVINAMVGCGGVEHERARQALRRLSALAGDAAAALADGAIDQWGEVLAAATEAQRQLHAGLVGAPHEAAIDRARALGAVGWKVNGAGGDGGSLTILTGGRPAAELGAALAALDRTWQILELRPSSTGVAVSPQQVLPGRR